MIRRNKISEKSFQIEFEKSLENIGYRVRDNRDYNREYAMDTKLVMEFLNATQPDAIAKIRKNYGTDTEATIINRINTMATKKSGNGILDVFKRGVDINHTHLNMMYYKPKNHNDAKMDKLYDENIMSVIDEVTISDKERVDLVIFLNGIAIVSFELKCEFSGQSYEDAIVQYREDRDPKNRLFLEKGGCFVNFAMDLNNVYMTNKVNGPSTYFLPFNQGRGIGIETGAGNPLPDETDSFCPTAYMWEDVLTKDSVIELISDFIFVEKKQEYDVKTGKMKEKESVIFPRYHQRDAIRKIVADVLVNKTSENYLIQHSAGSGKTNTISWLAYKMAFICSEDDKNSNIYNTIIVCTDSVGVDRHLQESIRKIEPTTGIVAAMDNSCTSADLAAAIKNKKKIIVTTLQKFPYILDQIGNMKNRTFAVIIDEAHSSTAGKTMAALSQVLGSGDTDCQMDVNDAIIEELKARGKQANASFFAFTATPKATTIEMFGRLNKNGYKTAFHNYSMKQAIEEGFIIDVLQNYVTYDTYFQVNKTIANDPVLLSKKTKKGIAKMVSEHPENIAQRVEIIVDHFREHPIHEVGGHGKGMIITGSREEAVLYYQAVNKYIADHNYKDIKALVAFSGVVNIDGVEYTESGMNNMKESVLPQEFDTDNYNLLVVANKYQTGFDQPKLCAMYVMKTLNGVNAVQTLSRLNRICPPYNKRVYVLDFVNSYDDMQKAFSKYYNTTVLTNTIVPESVYDLVEKVDSYHIFNDADIEDANRIWYDPNGIQTRDANRLVRYMMNAKNKLPQNLEDRQEIIQTLKSFVRCYEFILQSSSFEDVDVYKKYLFIISFLKFISNSRAGHGYNLKDKVDAVNFVQKQTGVHKNKPIKGDSLVDLPIGEGPVVNTDEEKALSEIIDEVNSSLGTHFDSEVQANSLLQMKTLIIKNEALKEAAKNNNLNDFKLCLNGEIENVLYAGRDQNKDFFTMLMNHEEILDRIMNRMLISIYNEMRK